VQSCMGRSISTIDSGKFNTLSYAESAFGEFIVDTGKTNTSNEGYEVAPQHDHDQQSDHLTTQLRVSEAMIMEATKRIDDMHALLTDYC
jgi:hypothetical protein